MRPPLTQAPRQRRGLKALAALGAGALITAAAWLVWQAAAEREALPADPRNSVPAHQREGPLANPWGAGPAVLGSERAAEPAAPATPPGAAPGRGATAATLAAPGAREALRAALAQLRAQAQAGEFVRRSLANDDAASLVAAWVAERHCRQAAQWRQVAEWRQRAGAPAERRGADAGGQAAGGGSSLGQAQCQDMPEAEAVEEALKTAGFAAPAEAGPLEPTRRPLDLTLALEVGDPLLVAEVLGASAPHEVVQQLQAAPWKLDARDLIDVQVVRAAVWLASCAPQRLGSGGAAGAGAQLNPACRDHPGLRQACLHEGLCDLRDLHDLVVRSMPAAAAGVAERLARTLSQRAGAGSAGR